MAEDRPQTGDCSVLAPGLRRIVAPNPSAMTGWGTNTYLLGEGEAVLIDPGPDETAHLAAILGALGAGERVGMILVTHAHLDHSALAPRLAAITDAPVLAYGDATAGRRPVIGHDEAGGGEGVDAGFRPTRCLADGEVLDSPAGRIAAIHTPGHMGNHLCFGWQGMCFTGDHVMGWSTSLVSPPDGDMRAYMDSLGRLAARHWTRFLPGHGAPVDDPAARLAALTAHRLGRETAILAQMAGGAMDLPALTAAVYTDIAPGLLTAARRNVLAHLIDLEERGMVVRAPGAGRARLYGLR